MKPSQTMPSQNTTVAAWSPDEAAAVEEGELCAAVKTDFVRRNSRVPSLAVTDE
jgi:hypothetical protein